MAAVEPSAPMERNLRMVGVSAVARAFGLSLILPFVALYLYNDLGVGYAAIGVLLALASVPPLLTASLGGLAADRLGRRRLFLVSLAGEMAMLFALAGAMALASLPGVILAFTGFALVSNFGGPALSAYVADFSFGSARTRAFTWFRVGHNVGFTLGVLAGGALVGLLGFVPVALAAALSALVAVVMVYLLLDPSPYDLEIANGRSAGVDGRSTNPSPRESIRVIARDRTFLALCLGFALAYLAESQWGITFPLFVHGALGISYAVLGAGLALNGVIVVLGQTATTNAVIGRRHTTIAIGGLGCYVAGFLGLGAAGAYNLFPVLAFFAAVFVLTVGENLMSIPQNTLPSNVAPPLEIGAYNGAFQTLTGFGPLLGLLVGGAALAAFSDPFVLWAVLMIPAIPAIALLRWSAGRLDPVADRA
jgi:MFS family permease